MNHSFKHEILGFVELNGKTHEVCVTADSQYDDNSCQLSIKLDRYLRLRDLLAEEKHIDASWLPKTETIKNSVSMEEITDYVAEVFEFWVRKVKNSIPKKLAVTAP
jgi:hypothetical protein